MALLMVTSWSNTPIWPYGPCTSFAGRRSRRGKIAARFVRSATFPRLTTLGTISFFAFATPEPGQRIPQFLTVPIRVVDPDLDITYLVTEFENKRNRMNPNALFEHLHRIRR